MSATATSNNTIPQHVLDRLENEWRQMNAPREQAPKPAAQPSSN